MLRCAAFVIRLTIFLILLININTHALAADSHDEIGNPTFLCASTPLKEVHLDYCLPLIGTLSRPALAVAAKLEGDPSLQTWEAGHTGKNQAVHLALDIDTADEEDGTNSCMADQKIENCLSDSGRCNKTCRDWPGLKRDTYHILVYQAVSVGVLYFLPESITNWTKDQKHWGFGKWLNRFREVHFDNDSWFFNYVQHPYWGLGYYVRASERGYDHLESFLYAASMSAFFEFFVEGQLERPSIQDLLATPIIGSLAGYYSMELRQRLKAKETRQWYDEVALIATDPFGSLNSVVDRLLGIKEERTMCSFMLPGSLVPPAQSHDISSAIHKRRATSGSTIGVQMSFDW
jgi:hypothetical protein